MKTTDTDAIPGIVRYPRGATWTRADIITIFGPVVAQEIFERHLRKIAEGSPDTKGLISDL